MRILKLFIIVAILAGAGYGVKNYMANAEVSARADEEMKAEEGEITKCKERLKMFYTAWDSYRKDHKGAEPPTIESLVPKYVKDGNLLVCPTFERWSAKGKPLSKGEVTIDRRKLGVSYGFQWLTAASGMAQRKLKDKAPLVICETHQEAIYTAAYKKRFLLEVYDDEKVGGLVGNVKSSPVLAVLRDGTVGDYDRKAAVPVSK